MKIMKNHLRGKILELFRKAWDDLRFSTISIDTLLNKS